MSAILFEAYAKCILAGEHAVLRGAPALVVPVLGKHLILQYDQSELDFKAEFKGEYGAEVQLLFWAALERALDLCGKSRGDLKGKVILTNEIPIGAGLGASAAVCVVTSKLLASKGWVLEEELYEFSRQIENLFHGESSGVDIAASISCTPIRFVRGEKPLKYNMKWQPQLYLSYSGSRGVTSECVKKVKNLHNTQSEWASEIDEQMSESVMMAENALHQRAEKGLFQLADALQKSRQCFERWGLVSAGLSKEMNLLMESGALAVKPTGSGDGGYVLSLWNKTPHDKIKSDLIPVFR